MKWLEERLKRLRGLDVYQPAAERPGHELRLDRNENWFAPRMAMQRLLLSSLSGVDPRGYPDGVLERLAEGISRQVGVPSDSVIPCNGADQAIDLLCAAFLRQGDRATTITPTFSMYRLRAAIAGAENVEVSMRPDFGLPVDRLLRKAGSEGVIFICSPNNPTGTQFGRAEVEEVLNSFKGLVVLDEAYVEFAAFSLSREVMERRNLAVLRTFSKAYGMAGLRLGYILANQEWAPHFLQKIQQPYPVNSIAAALALKLMASSSEVADWIRMMKNEREWLTNELRRIPGVAVPASSANFLMVGLPSSSARARRALFAKGVSTRDLGKVLDQPDCLRVTVGTRRMNRKFLQELREVCRN